MDDRYPQLTLTPIEFERHVHSMLNAMGHSLLEYRSEHREVIQGVDGEYEIDVSARFEFLGMEFLVLVECKHYKNSVKRETLQALYDKMCSVGAQKCALFTTSGFQSGALKYAEVHKIATVKVVVGRGMYFTKSLSAELIETPPWADLPLVSGWLIDGNQRSVVSEDHDEFLERFLFYGAEVG
ncbi:MAG: restriction endonuclease [Pseudomonas sp.]|jgi:restriction system protein|uniref:restriction endonuclease n=1 Tax=Pseudomonas sp. TaxID=306 RepID=UPI0023916042|nr:restriction endonuclease [Pseudomonas sp.]MDP9060203.1 restriction endonuclease [Pseudomonadota bacterium]MDE1912471.1 restriction endonuclease [Pseudomonas sp.]MDE2037135.1 restriction endonuclease [Pseudomonas sp.]MDE2194699.1 restriction endonuclease [Pseudomonas sp.]MDP9215565.1 restriction endonuclease [Pseudomonadota bacterium]